MQSLSKNRRFLQFHLVYWVLAGIALFISGYVQSNAMVSLTRNAWLMVSGGGLTFLMVLKWPALKSPTLRQSWLLFLVVAYSFGTVVTILINPVTFWQLGLDFNDFTWRHFTAGTMNFSMVMVFWGFCLILMFETGFKFPGGRSGPILPVTPSPKTNGIEVEGKGKKLVIPLREVCHLKAAADYVEVVLLDGSCYLKRATIQSLAGQLSSAGFLQIHRSIIVNMAAVTGHEGESKGSYTLVMQGGERLKTSRGYKAQVQKVLG